MKPNVVIKGRFRPKIPSYGAKNQILGEERPRVVGKYKWVSLANKVTYPIFCRQEHLLPNLKMVGRNFMVPERV